MTNNERPKLKLTSSDAAAVHRCYTSKYGTLAEFQLGIVHAAHALGDPNGGLYSAYIPLYLMHGMPMDVPAVRTMLHALDHHHDLVSFKDFVENCARGANRTSA